MAFEYEQPGPLKLEPFSKVFYTKAKEIENYQPVTPIAPRSIKIDNQNWVPENKCSSAPVIKSPTTKHQNSHTRL